MRTAFTRALVRAARADRRLVLLTGDHGYSLFDEFRQACPDQFVNAGVAEQNMVGVAAGLAKGGFRPVVYGLSAFVPVRVLEQIKLDVCYERLPVLFVGDGAGVVYGTLGVSHQCTEDVAAARALPNLAVLSPADAHEMDACFHLALRADGPVYLRMGKADRGPVHAETPRLRWGGLCPVRDGDGPLAWIATGSMVRTALEAASHWPDSAVVSAPCLKPLRHRSVAALCWRRVAVVVLEEHSVHGGLGSAVAEVVAARAPTWVCRVGVRDRFSATCGSYEHLIAEHGLDVESVVRRVRTFLTRLPLRAFRRNRTTGRPPALRLD
jgi:transketolase